MFSSFLIVKPLFNETVGQNCPSRFNQIIKKCFTLQQAVLPVLVYMLYVFNQKLYSQLGFLSIGKSGKGLLLGLIILFRDPIRSLIDNDGLGGGISFSGTGTTWIQILNYHCRHRLHFSTIIKCLLIKYTYQKKNKFPFNSSFF